MSAEETEKTNNTAPPPDDINREVERQIDTQADTKDTRGSAKRPHGSTGAGVSKFKNWFFYKRISIISMLTMILAFLFIDGAYFGIPRFYEHDYLHVVTFPTLSCRFLEGNTIDCFMYRLQGFLEVGWDTLYTNAAITVLVYLILALTFGRYWCGFACPFGLVQRLFSGSRETVGIKPIRMPEKYRKKFDRVKYVALFLVMLLSIAIGIPALGLTAHAYKISYPLSNFGPVHGFFIYLQMAVGLEPASYVVPRWSLVALIITLPLIFLMRHAYCRICPVGALLSLCSSSSAVSLEKDHRKCTKCGICYRVCPVDIREVYEEDFDKHVMTRECLMCLRCVELCPQEDCLKATFLGKTLAKSRVPPVEKSVDEVANM
jgi:polyferredoxin